MADDPAHQEDRLATLRIQMGRRRSIILLFGLALIAVGISSGVPARVARVASPVVVAAPVSHRDTITPLDRSTAALVAVGRTLRHSSTAPLRGSVTVLVVITVVMARRWRLATTARLAIVSANRRRGPPTHCFSASI
jgi:hypothetical protein